MAGLTGSIVDTHLRRSKCHFTLSTLLRCVAPVHARPWVPLPRPHPPWLTSRGEGGGAGAGQTRTDSYNMGGFDPLSPMIYTYTRDKDGNIEGVQSETLLGNACSDTLFAANTPGMWFTSQGDEVRPLTLTPLHARDPHPTSKTAGFVQVLSKLMKYYEDTPYPSDERLAEIATEINAPGVGQVGFGGGSHHFPACAWCSTSQGLDGPHHDAAYCSVAGAS